MNGPIVAFTATSRPAYLEETLASWRKVRGIGKAHLIFRCEPGHPEVEEICRKADFGASLRVIPNLVTYGVLSNPWHALETGFVTGADFVILGEDDSPVSDDVLEYFAWAQDTYAADEQVIAVSAHIQDARGTLGEVVRHDHFTCWVWGTWRDRWENLLRDDWDHDYRHKGWDWRITEHWVRRLGYRVIKPALSRSQDIGEFGGVHASPQDFPNAVSRCFVPEVPPQDYREITA